MPFKCCKAYWAKNNQYGLMMNSCGLLDVTKNPVELIQRVVVDH